MLLHLDCVPYINEFPVFKDEKLMLFRQLLQSRHCRLVEVCHDVDVSLEDGNVWPQYYHTISDDLDETSRILLSAM